MKAKVLKAVAEIAANDKSVSDKALKCPELADKLQASERLIRKMVAEKKIPVMKLGRLSRFDYDAVKKAITVLEKQPQTTNPQPVGSGAVSGGGK